MYGGQYERVDEVNQRVTTGTKIGKGVPGDL